jgi:ribonuclease Z
VLLFDCGEGAQYQLIRAGLNRGRIDAVFISHLHGDHFFGLPGLLSTLAMLGRTEPLAVVAPAGTGGILGALPGLSEADLSYAIEVTEIDEGFGAGVVYDGGGYTVEARALDHRVFSAGFRLQERPRPGRIDSARARAAGVTQTAHFDALRRGEAVVLDDGTRVDPDGIVGPRRRGAAVAYVLDTRPCAGGRELARGADLVMHDATFAEAMHGRAVETGHSTAREAAEIARDAGAQRLLLTHFSSRYADPAPLLAEARAVFPNTDAAEELGRYVLDAEEEPEGVPRFSDE